MKCGECPVATTNQKDKTDCYFCPFDKVDAFHSLHDCSHLSELVEKMAELLKEQQPKKGHWEKSQYADDRWHKCSECGKLTEAVDENGYKLICNYCRICGADMTD